MSATPSSPRPELKIRPAPKIREKTRRRTKRKAQWKLEPARAEGEGEGSTPILGAILLLGCAAALVVLGGPHGPDPHLIRAKELIERYEDLRVGGVRDYESTAYRGALAELDQVSGDSPSGAEAATLAQDIRSRIEAQKAAARSRAQEVAARQERRQSRDEQFFSAQKRSRLVQGGGHAVCGPEESAPHPAHHDHSSEAEEEPEKAE